MVRFFFKGKIKIVHEKFSGSVSDMTNRFLKSLSSLEPLEVAFYLFNVDRETNQIMNKNVKKMYALLHLLYTFQS